MAAVITLILVLSLVGVAVFEQPRKYPGDYYVAGFALFMYGLTQITTLSWLTLLFMGAGFYTIVKGAMLKQ